MKISAFVTAIAILAGVAGPSLAFDRSAPTSSVCSCASAATSRTTTSRPAACRTATTTYIKASQAYKEGKNSAQVKQESAENKKVCEKACGC